MTDLLARGGHDSQFERPPVFDALPARPGPLTWARQRRADAQTRLAGATRGRLAARLRALGEDSSLATGRRGLFPPPVRDHGRSRVAFAGDVVQIDGKRPPYVALARR